MFWIFHMKLQQLTKFFDKILVLGFLGQKDPKIDQEWDLFL